MTNVCTHINTDSGCLCKHIITAGVRKPNGECHLSPKHRDENQLRFCMPEASLTFSPDLVPSPRAEASCNTPPPPFTQTVGVRGWLVGGAPPSQG